MAKSSVQQWASPRVPPVMTALDQAEGTSAASAAAQAPTIARPLVGQRCHDFGGSSGQVTSPASSPQWASTPTAVSEGRVTRSVHRLNHPWQRHSHGAQVSLVM
jgi:hypothetical protein